MQSGRSWKSHPRSAPCYRQESNKSYISELQANLSWKSMQLTKRRIGIWDLCTASSYHMISLPTLRIYVSYVTQSALCEYWRLNNVNELPSWHTALYVLFIYFWILGQSIFRRFRNATNCRMSLCFAGNMMTLMSEDCKTGAIWWKYWWLKWQITFLLVNGTKVQDEH